MTTQHPAAIEVDGLRKSYRRRIAVDDVSFSVDRGEIFGILGPNGAGKTTTVECVSGLRSADAGDVRVHGVDPGADREAATRLIGVQLQESQLQAKLTVREALELWSAFYPDPRPWHELAERLGLVEHLAQRFDVLSGGQKQRLSVALALVGRPEVVILDELTTGLDPRARREVWDLVRDVRDEGTTVLLVTHQMEEARELCDRIAIIVDGRIRALDTPEGLVGGQSAATVIGLTPSAPIDLQSLRELPGVQQVRADGDRVVIDAAEDTALAVLTHLRDSGVTAHRLRVADGSLDRAYLEATESTETTEDTERMEEIA